MAGAVERRLLGLSQADAKGTYSSIAATGRTVGPYRGYIGGLFPPGVKMKMANFTPFKPADWVAVGNQAVGAQWAAWDWDNWIKPQIDLAAANGFNTFRIAGTMGGLARGQLTMAQYLARWKQVLDYTASKGLWLYPGGESFNDYGGCTQAFATDVLVQMATLFNGYSHVFAFDLVNEAMGSGANNGLSTGALVAAYCQALYTAVKAVTPIPLTCSAPHVGATTSALWSDSARRTLLNFVDFWDFHVYYDAAPADLAPFLTDTATYKPFLIGECGQTASAGTVLRASRMAALRSIADHPDCMGAGAWAITDQDVATSNQWGLWSNLPGQNMLQAAESTFNGSTIGASGWVLDGASSVTVALTQTAPIEGTDSLLVTVVTGSGGASAYRADSNSKPVSPGATVTATASVKQVAGAAQPTHVAVRFLTAAFATISTTLGADITPTGAPATVTASAVAPGNAAFALVQVGFGAAGSSAGDAVMVDNISLASSTATPRAEYLAGAQSLPSKTRAQFLDLALTSDQTLNGGNGTWVDATGMTITYAVVKPCRVKARMVLDGSLVTGASQAIGGRVNVDAAVVDSRTAIIGGATGAEVTATQTWSFHLAPGTHTIKGQVVNFGTATNNVAKSAHTHMVLEVEAA